MLEWCCSFQIALEYDASQTCICIRWGMSMHCRALVWLRESWLLMMWTCCMDGYYLHGHYWSNSSDRFAPRRLFRTSIG